MQVLLFQAGSCYKCYLMEHSAVTNGQNNKVLNRLVNFCQNSFQV